MNIYCFTVVHLLGTAFSFHTSVQKIQYAIPYENAILELLIYHMSVSIVFLTFLKLLCTM
jgi:hypothetical protein